MGPSGCAHLWDCAAGQFPFAVSLRVLPDDHLPISMAWDLGRIGGVPALCEL